MDPGLASGGDSIRRHQEKGASLETPSWTHAPALPSRDLAQQIFRLVINLRLLAFVKEKGAQPTAES